MVPAPAPNAGKMAPNSGGPDSGSKFLDSGNSCTAPLLTHDPGKHADSGSDQNIWATPTDSPVKTLRLGLHLRNAGQKALGSPGDAKWPRWR